MSRDEGLGLLPHVPFRRRLGASGLRDTLLLWDSPCAQTHLSVRDQASPANSNQAAPRQQAGRGSGQEASNGHEDGDEDGQIEVGRQ